MLGGRRLHKGSLHTEGGGSQKLFTFQTQTGRPHENGALHVHDEHEILKTSPSPTKYMGRIKKST